MEKINRAKEVFKIKNQIYKVAPHTSDIDVQFKRLAGGEYESLIKVHIPHKKNIVAVKRDASLQASIEKSKQAITKQIEKVHKSRMKTTPIRAFHFDDAA